MGRGFTLVEVLVVLVVVAITVSAAAPALASLGREDPETAVSRELVDILRSAHRRAVQEGVAVSVVVEPASARFWVMSEEATAPGVVRAGVIRLTPATRLIGSEARVSFVFDPQGPARSDSLVVQTEGGRAVVGADRWTGVAYVR